MNLCETQFYAGQAQFKTGTNREVKSINIYNEEENRIALMMTNERIY